MLINKRDPETTRLRMYLNSKSYVSFAGHEYLFGEDVSLRRAEIFKRDKGKCYRCGAYYGWDYGHMDHVEGGLGPQRCDCPHNLQWACPKCHSKKHNREPRWSRKG